MDPITILAGCTAAYNTIKQGISVGKEIQGMIKDVSSIMDGVGTLTRIANDPRPALFSGKSAEALAMEAYSAKSEAERMFNEVKNVFISQHGLQAWDWVLAETNRIKKEQKRILEEEAKEAEICHKQLMNDIMVYGSAFLIVIVLALGITITIIAR